MQIAEQLSLIAIEFKLVEQLKYINLGGGFPSYSAPLTHHNEQPKPLKEYFKAIKLIRPLDYIPYNKEEAMNLLMKNFGYQKYPQVLS